MLLSDYQRRNLGTRLVTGKFDSWDQPALNNVIQLYAWMLSLTTTMGIDSVSGDK